MDLGTNRMNDIEYSGLRVYCDNVPLLIVCVSMCIVGRLVHYAKRKHIIFVCILLLKLKWVTCIVLKMCMINDNYCIIFKGGMTHLQALQISMKFLLQMAFNIR